MLFLKQNYYFMKFKYLFLALFFIGFKAFSQENQNILFTIDDEPYYSQEFLTVYKKNLQLVTDSKSDLGSYLKLFIDYKLKVKEGKALGLDTLQKFKNELKQYKSNLVLPYLKDKEVTNNLIKEAYDRLKKEVNVSHILIFLNPDASPKDTLTAYNALIEARNIILEGNDFAEIAKKYSKDPTVEQNGGRIGYFTALQMVYPFENMAFKTPVNEVSMPFRTKFGYHILKVNDIRESEGEVEVAHIMFKNDSTLAVKRKIDSVYKVLLTDKTGFFELAKKVSEDRASGMKGGILAKFGTGKMIEDFSKVSFSLKNEGDISKPFKTQFGWHIVKLIKKYPIDSFEKMEGKLKQEVERDERSNLISKSVIDKLFQQYTIIVNEEALQQFHIEGWKNNPENFHQNLLSINNKNILQKRFISYLKTVSNMPLNEAFAAFKEKEVLEYYTENIENSNAEFATTYKEFNEGLLLFDLLEKEVWEKAKDNNGLQNYFNSNKKKYKSNELKAIKGEVISDYQNYLEEQFSKQLRDKYKVKIIGSEKKSLKKMKI